MSFPGYICVYSTRYFLAKSMKAFMGRLHLAGAAAAEAEAEAWPLADRPPAEWGEAERSAALSRSGLAAADREVRRWRAMLLRTYTADESSGVKS